MNCPICDSPGLQPFVEFPDVPVSGVFCTDAGQSVPHRDLVFDYCAHCSFVSQRISAGVAIDYAGVTRPTARQLPSYAESMLLRLVDEGARKLVFEVGCNDGTFLNELRRVGFKRLLGIEPSLDLAQHVRNQGHEVVQKPLDQALAEEIVAEHGHAEIVVCRHTLEHVPQPMAFLAALRHLLQAGGLACIEVPSLRPIIEYLHIHELWDEHISYFLPETLSLALGKAGFEIETLRVKPYREMENIVVWARAAQPQTLQPATPPRFAELCASFNARWQAKRQALLQKLADSPAPFVALGASHPQSNFLNFSGYASSIHSVIDDDPHKIGHWLPLQDHHAPILPSNNLTTEVKDGTLVLTGFGYPTWMAKARTRAATHAQAVIDVSEMLFTPAEKKEDAA